VGTIISVELAAVGPTVTSAVVSFWYGAVDVTVTTTSEELPAVGPRVIVVVLFVKLNIPGILEVSISITDVGTAVGPAVTVAVTVSF